MPTEAHSTTAPVTTGPDEAAALAARVRELEAEVAMLRDKLQHCG
jgi:hypothetical protein